MIPSEFPNPSEGQLLYVAGYVVIRLLALPVEFANTSQGQSQDVSAGHSSTLPINKRSRARLRAGNRIG